MSVLNALSGFSFAGAISASAKQALAEQCSVKMVAPYSSLLQKGDAAGGALLVSSGAVRVFYIDQRGRQGTLYRVETGEACFFSLQSAMRGIAYPAWAEAEAYPTQFVRIPAQLYVDLYSREPAIQQFTYDSLSSRVLQLMAILEESATLAIEQRTAALLLDLADADGRVQSSQARLAEHLGTAREVIARTLRDFRTSGLIATHRGTVQILGIEALRKLAGRAKF